MWRLCNDLPFELMGEQAGKVINLPEIALAQRFVHALDESNSAEVLDPAILSRARIFVLVEGEGGLAGHANRLNGELDGLRLLGLPLQVVGTDLWPHPRPRHSLSK